MDQGLDTRPAWRGWLHTAGAAVSVPAGVWLVAGLGGVALVACAVYSACVTALLAVSAGYHRLVRDRAWRTRLRRVDHAMIFVVIAGCYTPVCLLAVGGRLGVLLLVGVWVVCAAAAVAKLVAFDATDGWLRWAYPAVGWVSVVAVPAMVSSGAGPVAAVLGAAGVCFTVGAVVLWRRAPDPAPSVFGYHEVFHALTLVGLALTFVAVSQAASAG
jgi:hemolysin III